MPDKDKSKFAESNEKKAFPKEDAVGKAFCLRKVELCLSVGLYFFKQFFPQKSYEPKA